MMKHYLSVEGKKLEIFHLSLREGKLYSAMAFEEDRSVKSFHDFSYTPDPIMDSTAIDMQSAYSFEIDHADKIRKRIDALEERMVEIAFDYIQHDAPFAEKVESQKEWHRLNQQVHGLFQAIEIVEGEHDESVFCRFSQGVVQAAVALSRGGEEIDPE